VVAAEQVCPRTALDGTLRPARLAATAAAEFAAGRASLPHVEATARVLRSAKAERQAPDMWAGAELQLAAKAGGYTPRRCSRGARHWSRSKSRTVRIPTSGRPPR
jgi:hypothetical protein